MTDPATDKLISKARRYLVKLGKDADAAARADEREKVRQDDITAILAEAVWRRGQGDNCCAEALERVANALSARLRKEAGEG